jgi:hypothetical protein
MRTRYRVLLHEYFLHCIYCLLVTKLYFITRYLHVLNTMYIICSNLRDMYQRTAMFVLTVVYKDRAQTVGM